MKWLLTILLLSCFPALAQERQSAHLEGANVIAVLLPDSGALAFERIALLLEKHGYRLATRDQVALHLTTKVQPMCDCNYFLSLDVKVMGHTAMFSGIAGSNSSFLRCPLNYSAHNHVAFANFDFVAKGWFELETIANALPNKRKVVYFHHP